MKNILIMILGGISIFFIVMFAYHNMHSLVTAIEGFGNISTSYIRAKMAAKADSNGKSEICVGVIINMKDECEKDVFNGVKAACKEINDNGGISGRKIKLIEQDSSGTVTGSKNAMSRIIHDENIVAVIGGSYFNDFIAITPLCEFNGILLISPILTSGIVSEQNNFRLVFVNYPNIKQDLGVMYEFLRINNLKKTVIISPPEFQYGYYYSNAFDRYYDRDSSGVTGIISRQTAYSASDCKRILDSLDIMDASKEYDSILIGGGIDMITKSFETIKEMKERPICLLNDEMEQKELVKNKACNGIKAYLPSTYDPDSDKQSVQYFRTLYRKLFGEEPDVYAAQGYDTMMVLMTAIRNAGSTVPAKIAAALHKIKFDQNVTTSPYISFNSIGELESGKLIMKCLDNGRFKTLKNLKIQN